MLSTRSDVRRPVSETTSARGAGEIRRLLSYPATAATWTIPDAAFQCGGHPHCPSVGHSGGRLYKQMPLARGTIPWIMLDLANGTLQQQTHGECTIAEAGRAITRPAEGSPFTCAVTALHEPPNRNAALEGGLAAYGRYGCGAGLCESSPLACGRFPACTSPRLCCRVSFRAYSWHVCIMLSGDGDSALRSLMIMACTIIHLARSPLPRNTALCVLSRCFLQAIVLCLELHDLYLKKSMMIISQRLTMIATVRVSCLSWPARSAYMMRPRRWSMAPTQPTCMYDGSWLQPNPQACA